MTLVGVGVAGVISTVAFAVFPLGGIQMESGDLVETLVLLGMAFASVLFVGFVSRPSRHKDDPLSFTQTAPAQVTQGQPAS